jgi:hypothetical protein
MSIIILIVHIHEKLPDRCTSIHSQEESTENRDTTNESNIKVRLFKNIFIQCIRIFTRLWAQRTHPGKAVRAGARTTDTTKKRGSMMVTMLT